MTTKEIEDALRELEFDENGDQPEWRRGWNAAMREARRVITRTRFEGEFGEGRA